ncbi:MAG: AMP-binding protein [Akkermansia sp.]|nr:AMP-binding protein [Akkermansia sp.]
MSAIVFEGADKLGNRPCLFIPNRMCLDALIELEKRLGGPSQITYLVEESFVPDSRTAQYLRSCKSDGILFNFRRVDAIRLRGMLLERLDAGKHVVYLPGRAATIKGTLADIPSPFLTHLGALHISPVPVYVGYYNDNIALAFGSESQHSRLYIRIMPQLSPGPEAGARLLQAWMEAGSAAFAALPCLNGSLISHLVAGMKAHPHARIIDGIDDSSLTYGKLLGAAMAFSRRLGKLTSGRRVGIILPPGKGAAIANLGCLLAGIAPVNINYTSSERAFHSAVRQAGIDRFISADRFMRKLQGFPWPPQRDIIFIERELAQIGKRRIAFWVAMARMLPMHTLERLFHLNDRSGEDEAILLFTSGSSGEPKGVPLSHKNILGNIAQCSSRIVLQPGSRFLGSLPVFHCFGMLLNLWFPLLMGYDVVTYPSPMESRRLCELVRHYEIALVITTPTFARAMMRRAQPDTFKSVEYFIVGAEKLPHDLAEEFLSRFGIHLAEGYGLTEASPVCSVNLPDAPLLPGTPYYVPGTVDGTVGAPLPGLAVRITDPEDDDKELPFTRLGILWLKGVNIFKGYSGRADLNSLIFRNGWFRTGDVARVDLNGFIKLEGRRARFSKIGGEMIPHDALEQSINRALKIQPDVEERKIAVVGVPDKQKGEAIVMLSTQHRQYLQQELISLRYALIGEGVPALWCPKEIIPVEEIPMLPSGKLDLAGCRALAFEALRIPMESTAR